MWPYIYYIKSKSNIYTKFLHYKALVEKETSAKIQKIKADNGGEYNSEKFHQFCQKEGISIHYTVPYTPEQNGVAERLNLTLLNKVRSVLAESSLPKDLWGEIITTCNYLNNISPHKGLDKTPYKP